MIDTPVFARVAGPLASFTVCLALGGVAEAGTITAQGNVTALDDVAQLPSVAGSALFDELIGGMIPLDQYPGLTFHTGELGTILAGVTEVGEAIDPSYASPGVFFPHPIAGSGVQLGSIIYNGGAVTFSDAVTQFGLTAGGAAPLYITAWDQDGAMIGQVSWEPDEIEAAFVGIDTMGVPIGLLTVGNDDVFGGAEYDSLGVAANSDSWMWGLATPCGSDAECFDDGWSCTAAQCDEGACSYALTDAPCDDDDACTETDTCTEGQCVGVAVQCSDDNVCTFDTCHPKDGCSNTPIDDCCLSDDDCPEGSTCLLSSNTCVGGPPPPPPPPDDDDDGEPDPSDDEGETGSDTGSATDDKGGCSCSSAERGGGALLGLLGLVLLGCVRRRPG
ncbi:MAG: MYXO-CTERM sorting domain-containing protein [Enhygromyxa sp.]